MGSTDYYLYHWHLHVYSGNTENIKAFPNINVYSGIYGQSTNIPRIKDNGN